MQATRSSILDLLTYQTSDWFLKEFIFQFLKFSGTELTDNENIKATAFEKDGMDKYLHKQPSQIDIKTKEGPASSR